MAIVKSSAEFSLLRSQQNQILIPLSITEKQPRRYINANVAIAIGLGQEPRMSWFRTDQTGIVERNGETERYAIYVKRDSELSGTHKTLIP